MQTELNALDHHYAQLIQQMRCLGSCLDSEVLQIFSKVLESLERLFALESQLMDTYHFPASRCHVEQHARVLAGLHRAHSQVMRGELMHGRHAGTHLLMNWFELHNGTLDACLMVWLESVQAKRTMPAIARGTLPPQIMRDLNRKASARWRPPKPTDQNNAASSSGQNKQGPGEQ